MATKVPQATHTGKLRVGDIEFDCAVLDDAEHTRVISETNFMEAMGMYRSGALSTRRAPTEGSSAQIPLSLAYKNLKPFVDQHLSAEHFTPLAYRTPEGRLVTVGLPATIIPKICEVWIDADRAGALKRPRQQMIGRKSDILLRGFAHIGIIALVDEATGFQELRDREALQAILDKYLVAEHAKWAKRFPDEFYREMFKLRGWQWKGMKVNRPSVVGHYTNDVVWDRLAPGLLDELRRLNPKDDKGNRKTKHHQWLTEQVGHPALANHLSAVIALMRASTSWDQFSRFMARSFPKVGTTRPLPIPDPEA